MRLHWQSILAARRASTQPRFNYAEHRHRRIIGAHFAGSIQHRDGRAFAGGSNLLNLPSLKRMENRLIEAMRRFLVRRREQLDVPNLDAAVYVAFHAAASVITRHLLQPDWLRDEEIVEELVRLMLRYFGVKPA